MLLPAAIYSVKKALHIKREYLLIASFLFIFSIQQLTEGLLWLAIKKGKAEEILSFATFYLAFSHLIWLSLAPLAVALIEKHPFKKRIFFSVTLLGFIFGCSIYLPLLFYDNRLSVEVVNLSIFYNVNLLYDGFVSKDQVGLVYASIITLPMLFSGNGHIRNFGILLVLTGLPAYITYYHAFISVWCFFAGIVSLYILYILSRLSKYRVHPSQSPQ